LEGFVRWGHLCPSFPGQYCPAQLVYRAMSVCMVLLELYRSMGKGLDLPPVDLVGMC